MDHKTIAINDSTPLLQLLQLYLRNDSFFDMSARREFYVDVLEVPCMLARHPFLAAALTKGLEDEEVAGETENLPTPTQESSSASSDSSILSLFEKLQKQVDYFQDCADRSLVIVTNEEQEAFAQDMAFATQIGKSLKDTRDRLRDHEQRYMLEFQIYYAVEGKLGHERSQRRSIFDLFKSSSRASIDRARGGIEGGDRHVSLLPLAPTHKSEDLDKAAMHTKYTQIMQPLTFDSCPLATMATEEFRGGYLFLERANKIPASFTASGRIRRIMKELASLSTSLPVEGGAGIFARGRGPA